MMPPDVFTTSGPVAEIWASWRQPGVRRDVPNRGLVLLLVLCAHVAIFRWILDFSPVGLALPGRTQELNVAWVVESGALNSAANSMSPSPSQAVLPPISAPAPVKLEKPRRVNPAKVPTPSASKPRSKSKTEPLAAESASKPEVATSASGGPVSDQGGTLAAGAGQSSQGAGQSGSQDYSAPRFDAAYLSNPAPHYPSLSREMGEEGRVFLRVQVSTQGRPLNIAVYKSSGYTRLDSSASEAVRRWQFIPGRLGGQPVVAHVIVPINFFLE